jgi:hypothetical protein
MLSGNPPHPLFPLQSVRCGVHHPISTLPAAQKKLKCKRIPKQMHVHAVMHLYAWVTVLRFTKGAGPLITSDELDDGSSTVGIHVETGALLMNSFCYYAYFARNMGVCNMEIASDYKPAKSLGLQHANMLHRSMIGIIQAHLR